MSQVELIWGAFSLMLLGALVSMCMKCRKAENKQKTSSDSQRNQCLAADYIIAAVRERNSAQAQRQPVPLRNEDQQRFERTHSYSTSRQDHLKRPYNMPGSRNSNERLSVASHLEACAESRYQYFEKEMQTDRDPAYVEPVPADHFYNCQKCLGASNDDDYHSYQNVAGPFGNDGRVVASADVYENSTVIQLWKHSQITENSSSDDEPDYINACPKRKNENIKIIQYEHQSPSSHHEGSCSSKKFPA